VVGGKNYNGAIKKLHLFFIFICALKKICISLQKHLNNMNNQEIFPKEEMIELMKSHDFKLTDSKLITNFWYDKPINPFDKFTMFTMEFDNGFDNLLVAVEKVKNGYTIRMGENSGWVGGLQSSHTEYAFDIPKLNFEEFKKGFLNAIENQEYCLVTKWGTGNIRDIVFKGSLAEIKQFALDSGFEVKDSNSKHIDFYCVDNTKKSREVMVVYVLDSDRQENIKNSN
jgi:hypothetical protein